MDSFNVAAQFRETYNSHGLTWLSQEREKLTGVQAKKDNDKKVDVKENVQKEEALDPAVSNAVANLYNVIEAANKPVIG